MRKSIVFLSVILIMVLGFTMGLQAEKAEFELKLGTDGSLEHPYNVGAKLFIERVKELTDGRVNITLYPGGSLGDELTMLDSLSMGDLDMEIAAVPNCAQHAPKLNFFSLSFLFEDADHFIRAITDEKILNEVQNIIKERDLGFSLLGICTPGHRNFYTNKGKLRTPAEIKGLNIRVMAAPIEARIWKTLGCNPVSIPTGEVYTGLQTGLLDAAEHELAAYYVHSIYEVAPYYSNTGHQWTASLLLVSDLTWNKLPQDIQDVFKKVAKEFSEYEVDYVVNVLNAKIRKELEEKGVTFYEVDKESFKKILFPLQEMVAKEYNTEEILERIRELKDK